MNFLVHFKRIITTGLFVGAVFCCASVHGMSSSSNQNQEQLNAQLIAAAKNNNLLQAQEALLAGAAVDAQDKDGWTPLHRAAWEGYVEVVKLLLEKNAAVDVQDKYGWTPLYWAAECGRVEVVKLLLEKNAVVDAQDKDGWTPLHRAAGWSHVEFVQILVENGANIDLTEKKQRTAYDFAVENGHQNYVFAGENAYQNIADYLQQVAHYYTDRTKVQPSQQNGVTPDYFALAVLKEDVTDFKHMFDDANSKDGQSTPRLHYYMRLAHRCKKLKSLEFLADLHYQQTGKLHHVGKELVSMQQKMLACVKNNKFSDVEVKTQN